MDYMNQCLLKDINKKVEMIAWIDSKCAKKKKIVIDKDGTFWKVKKVYTRMEKEKVLENERNYLFHREATDI